VSVFYRRTEQGIFLERKPASSGISHESFGVEDSDIRNTPYKDLMESSIQFMAVLKPNKKVCLVNTTTVLCLVNTKTAVCLVNTTTVVCLVNTTTVVCLVNTTTAVCLVNTTTVVCLVNTTTVVCLVNTTTVVCLVNPTTMVCLVNTTTVVSKWANAWIFAEIKGSCEYCVASKSENAAGRVYEFNNTGCYVTNSVS
jgi:hypothetical protein